MPTLPVVVGSVKNAEIVQLILDEDPIGGELLYQHYARGLLFLARRYSVEHAEDCIHDAILCAIEQIRAGKLTSPEALPGYLATILRRTSGTRILRRRGERETRRPLTLPSVLVRTSGRAKPVMGSERASSSSEGRPATVEAG